MKHVSFNLLFIQTYVPREGKEILMKIAQLNWMNREWLIPNNWRKSLIQNFHDRAYVLWRNIVTIVRKLSFSAENFSLIKKC